MTLKELLGDAFKEDLTVDDISTALAGISFPDQASEIEKLKSLVSKANSEAAGYKKQLQERMTEEEKQKAETEEKWTQMEQKLAQLEKDKAVGENTRDLLALGYDEALAVETAQAMYENNWAKVKENQKKHQDARDQKLRAELLQQTPAPQGGNQTPDVVTKEQFAKMDFVEMMKLHETNPELYKSLTEDS